MEKRIKKIVDLLDEKKAEDIEVIDLNNSNYLANHVIIATTLNNKHASSLLFYIKKTLKGSEKFLNSEECDEWSILDCGDLFIHIMSQDKRDEYNLEEFLNKLKDDKSNL